MKRPALPGPVRSLLLTDVVWRVLPTPAAAYFNRQRVTTPVEMPSLPSTEWSRRERRALLSASEERLRNIEGKGPGLATVSAIIVGAVLIATTSGWQESTLIARILLAAATLYAVLCLCMPIYLVGPLKRHTVHVAEIQVAAQSDEPEEVLAAKAGEAAMLNDLQNQRLTNLLDAAQRELIYTLVLVVLWALLVPATGILRNDQAPTPQYLPPTVSPDFHHHWAPGTGFPGQ
jgi:hypothetical protein